jgi:hypothetical protein
MRPLPFFQVEPRTRCRMLVVIGPAAIVSGLVLHSHVVPQYDTQNLNLHVLPSLIRRILRLD